MKTNRQAIPQSHPSLWSLIWGPIVLVNLVLLVLMPPAAQGQATASPPERLACQGFVTDGAGIALATNAPKNYNIIFRIWNDPSAGNRLWAEQQTVTVDKGYFSALLGEGSQYASEPHPNLSTLFGAADASDRYVEFTVKGIGSGGTDVTILPRMRLLSSPYAFLAKSAGKLVSTTGADLVSSSGGGITVNGPLTANAVTATSYAGPLNGANITAGTVGSAQIASGAIGALQIANGAVGASQLASGAVGTAQIASFAVGSSQIAPLAVGPVQIGIGAVGAAQLAVNSVGSAQIANGSISPVDIAVTSALWDNSSGNISYNAGNVSVGTNGAPKNLAVTGNANVAGNLTIGTGTNVITFHPPLVIESRTTTNQTQWDIKDIDLTAFANNAAGFKIRVYEQRELTPFDVRTFECLMVFEQPGFTKSNSGFPTSYIGYSVGFGGYAIISARMGDPAVTSYNNIINENNLLYLTDYNPGTLNGGSNQKSITPAYHIWVAFHPEYSGRVVVSDY